MQEYHWEYVQHHINPRGQKGSFYIFSRNSFYMLYLRSLTIRVDRTYYEYQEVNLRYLFLHVHSESQPAYMSRASYMRVCKLAFNGVCRGEVR